MSPDGVADSLPELPVDLHHLHLIWDDPGQFFFENSEIEIHMRRHGVMGYHDWPKFQDMIKWYVSNRNYELCTISVPKPPRLLLLYSLTPPHSENCPVLLAPVNLLCLELLLKPSRARKGIELTSDSNWSWWVSVSELLFQIWTPEQARRHVSNLENSWFWKTLCCVGSWKHSKMEIKCQVWMSKDCRPLLLSIQ